MNQSSKKKKILYLITKSNWGGAQRYVLSLANSFNDKYKVLVSFGGTGEEGAEAGELAKGLKSREIETIFIKSFMRDISLFREFSAFFELFRIFRSEKPDIAHLNSSKAGGIGALACRLAGVPKIIFTSHGLAYDEDRNIFSKTAIFLATWMTFLLCHKVIVISKDNFQRAKGLFFCSKKIVLIYNGITPITGAYSKEKARGVLGVDSRSLPSNPVIIGIVAELIKNKGLEYLVEAASILKKKKNDFRVCVIGSGEKEEDLKKLAESNNVLEKFIFFGFKTDAPHCISAFDIFVLPSVKEGLPYVLLEASSLGVPAVGSRIPGIKDIVEDGVSGLLFEAKNPEDLAEKLKKLIGDENLRKEMGQKAKEIFESKFSAREMLAETEKLYG